MSLANKYRPKTLNEVIGQDYITSILRTKLEDNVLHHCIIFVGQYGTGKSSYCRILANELNAYTIELDASRVNSVDAIRQVMDSANQKPLGYKCNALIIDEPQNLSKVAFDSMLKFIEEPPNYVYVFFASTDVDNIPSTIKSRCEVYTLNSIPSSLIFHQLETICNIEGFMYDDKALELIAKSAKGSMRQAITNLELLSANEITVKHVQEQLLGASYTTMINILFAYLDNNADSIVSILSNIENVEKFTQSFFTFMLDVQIYEKTSKKELVNIPDACYNDIQRVCTDEYTKVNELISRLYELQFYGKGSPIAKELLIACLLRGV